MLRGKATAGLWLESRSPVGSPPWSKEREKGRIKVWMREV